MAAADDIIKTIDDLAFHVTGKRLGEQVVNKAGNWARTTDLRTAIDDSFSADRGDRARIEQIHAWEKATSAKDPAAIAALIPGDLARAVADELAARLKG